MQEAKTGACSRNLVCRTDGGEDAFGGRPSEAARVGDRVNRVALGKVCTASQGQCGERSGGNLERGHISALIRPKQFNSIKDFPVCHAHLDLDRACDGVQRGENNAVP